MGVNPFKQSTETSNEMSPLGSSEFMVPDFWVFKAGGSSDPTINSSDEDVLGEKQISEK